jgi:predicted RNA-binding Zn ribbon-like protein
MSRVQRTAAPGMLSLVESFANTHAYAGHPDAFDSLGAANEWMSERGFRSIGDAELAKIRHIRGRIRRAIADAQPGDIEWLNMRIKHARIVPAILPECDGVRFEQNDADSLEGRLLVAIATSVVDGSWSRMQLCANASECGVAFYDRSRSRQGRWCSAAVCGNRINSRAFRRRESNAIPSIKNESD